MLDLPPPEVMFAIIIVIFFAIGLHEYAHCKVADAAGDPTPGIHGRVTLNLTKHFEMMGTIMIILTSISGFGIGWGKPAPIDPRKMRNPRWDTFAAVAAGPISNLLQASFFAIWFRVLARYSPQAFENNFMAALLFYGVTTNLALCFFNLIPLGPLDGHWLVGQLLPDKQRYYWYRFNRQVGGIALFAIIIFSQLAGRNGGPNLVGMIMGRPVAFMYHFLTGSPFPA